MKTVSLQTFWEWKIVFEDAYCEVYLEISETKMYIAFIMSRTDITLQIVLIGPEQFSG